ncbi:MAG: uroporphyrinogen-III C-methyltransferase [Burkholderiales bacterium]|nr:uroporphyrinogen-III C-methyltransferase [Burkholderiales bacterium]
MGTVYLVGAGPGAPDLLTLRAADLLRRADIVFHDALVHPDTLALAEKAEKIAVGKRCGRHSTAQRFINKRLVDAAQRYAIVVRLKGGDPMLFGRAQEEIDALQEAGIEYAVVPGITAALAASATLGISLTRRGMSRNVSFITPRTGKGEDPHDWARSALAADTCAIYMGVGEAAQIAATLMDRGASPDLPVVVLENASLPNQRSVALRLSELGTTASFGFTGPAVILLGEVYDRLQSATAALASRRTAAA